MNAASGGAVDRRSVVAEALRKIDDLTARLAVAEAGDTEPIAVVGMGCRLPGGVHDPAGLWRLLRDGGSGIVRVPADRWDADEFYSDDHTTAGTICSRDGGFLTSWSPAEFDAEFFGISPREADAMDPQQRLMLEVAWEALENAGITAQGIRGTKTGIFVGMTAIDYAMSITPSKRAQDYDPYLSFGNAPNFTAGRLSYFLGVHGPAMMLDTACSSSLVTIHLACQSLRRRESDAALAAGVNLILSPHNSISTSRWGMLAPDGQCKTFDASADGYVRSEGAGVVVLKRLSDAQRDGDRILAVVRGSAVNQDGPSSGQTVPSGPAQQAVVRTALAAARLQPGDIDYIEAHGTGTALGDPIELDALSAVFGDRGGSAPLVLGSVKTNLGHLESAAGVTGFIKTVLSVQHGFIPRHLHFATLTPNASAGASKFEIAAQGRDWPAVDRARRAGVSSFGASGTNAHVVVEQAPAVSAQPTDAEPVPVVSTLLLSAKSPERIAKAAGALAEWLAGDGAQVPLADVAYTLTHRRSRFKYRAAVCARDHAGAVAGLTALSAGESAPGVVPPRMSATGSAGTVFVFSGQGSHWAGMGRRLLAEEPVFAAAVDELEPDFVAQVGFSLRDVISSGQAISGDAQVQPVIMGLQLALVELWRSHGVVPDAVIGHSMGEVTAAVVAGALTCVQGLAVIAARSSLMSRQAGQGAVALLELDAEATATVLADYPQVAVAGLLSPRQTVVAGEPAQVEAVIAAVSAMERFARRVNMEVASHTAFMDPILDELRAALAGVVPQAPQVPFLSTVVDAAGPAPTLDADYWVANVRRPALVSQAVTAAGRQYDTFIEISPHPILTHTIGENLTDVPHHSVGTLLRDGDDTVGFHQNLSSTHPDYPPAPPAVKPGPVLPTTPWRHTHHWLDTQSSVAAAESAPRSGTLLGTHIIVGSTPPVHLWQARLAPEAKPYPGGHRNNGLELVPASVLLQTLSDAAAVVSPTSTVTDVRFELPIVVDRPQVIQVVADLDSITVSSKPVTDGAAPRWVRHLTARLTHAEDGAPAENVTGAADPGAAGEQLTDESVTELWLTWGSEGRPFGWSVDSGRYTDEALQADVDAGPAGTVALLDAALHVARLVDADNPQLMVPAAIGSVRLGEGPVAGVTRVTVARRSAADAPAGELVLDLTASTPDGAACLDVRGIRYATLDAAQTADPGSIAHVIDWQPWESAPETPDAPGTVAVVGDSAAAGTLRDGLTAAGHVPADVGAAQAVLYVAGPAAPAETDLDYAARLTGEVADLVSRLVEREDNPPALWIITHGVHEAASDDAVRQSCLWGLAGVIRAEQPQLCGGLVDLPDEGTALSPAQLPALSGMLRTPAKAVLVLRDGQFLAPTFTAITGPAEREPTVCRPDAAYLITGGLGALGLLMAGWLADRGARRLVLAGRTGLPPRRTWDDSDISADVRQRIAAIRALEHRGVTVDVAGIDVGSRDGVQALLDRRDVDGAPPIRGIIHAAGLTDGQLLTEIDADRLRGTLWPKIGGAQVLHEAFPPGSVDFFFMTAAAGAVFGVPGQGAYATGNAYLDGLARARHQRGCHSVSLDWVAWKGLGFGAEAHVVLHELERLGSRPISPAEAFAAWDHVEHYDVAQAVMVPLPSADGAAAGAAAGAPARDWSELPAADVRSELEIGLRTILARELRMPEADLALDRPFAELGLNSVMVMAVRRDTEQLVGLELSATMLYNHPTVTALAAYLTGRVLPQQESGDGEASADGAPESADSVLDELFDSVESASAGWEGI